MKTFVLFTLFLAAASARSVYYPRANNLQTFTGNLGGAAPAVTSTGDSTRPFEVGGDTFVKEAGALQRSCSKQFNACANQANGGGNTSLTVAQCQTQETSCNQAASSSSSSSSASSVAVAAVASRSA